MALLFIPVDKQINIIKNFLQWLDDEQMVDNLTPILQAKALLSAYENEIERLQKEGD